MLGQLHEAIKILKIEGHDQHCIVLKVTNECHVKCEHCYEESWDDIHDGGIDLMVVEKALSGLTNWLLCVMGGEPMRYPEKVKKIVEIGKKNNMLTMLVTSGFWIRDDKLRNFVLEEVKPLYLTFSVNEWTNKIVPIEDINYMGDLCKDRKDITMFASSVYGNTPDMKKEDNDFQKLDKGQAEINKQLRHQFFRTPVPLINRGRGSKLDHRVPRFNFVNEVISCNCGGITVEPSGELYSNCPNVKFGCRFGHLNDYANLNVLADKIHKPKFRVTGLCFGAAEACRKVEGISCLDPKWASKNAIVDVRM